VAEYDLGQVKVAAKNKNIEYRGRKVGQDIANLGYDINDVSNCLCLLSPANFRKTHYYQDQPDDEYICQYKKNLDDEYDDLYIKFCLLDGGLVIDLASFHLP